MNKIKVFHISKQTEGNFGVWFIGKDQINEESRKDGYIWVMDIFPLSNFRMKNFEPSPCFGC